MVNNPAQTDPNATASATNSMVGGGVITARTASTASVAATAALTVPTTVGVVTRKYG